MTKVSCRNKAIAAYIHCVSGQAGVRAGARPLTIVARATGYEDSAAFVGGMNAVD